MTNSSERREDEPRRDRLEEMFESLLASKLRPEIRQWPEEIERALDTEPEALTGLPIKANGDLFTVGDGWTAVVCDVEIPDGSVLDGSLVVKGNVRVGSGCRILKNLKALGGISIADGSVVKANVVSGDAVHLGRDTIVEGEVHADVVELSRGARIRGRVDAKEIHNAGQSVSNPRRQTLESLLRKAEELLGER